MGRKKLTIKKIENPASRQATYSKRKDGILKKANELAVLCDTDVGLIMFSPNGRLTSFASNGRIEDVLLRFVGRSDGLRGGAIKNGESLHQSLIHMKHEVEMLEKLEKIETLEEKFFQLNEQQHEAQKKMRYYTPDVEKITSLHEAQACQQFIVDAIRRVEQAKTKWLHNKTAVQKPESIEVPAVDINDADQTTNESVDSVSRRNPLMNDHVREDTQLPVGPHLSISYLQSQSHWNLPGTRHAP